VESLLFNRGHLWLSLRLKCWHGLDAVLKTKASACLKVYIGKVVEIAAIN